MVGRRLNAYIQTCVKTPDPLANVRVIDASVYPIQFAAHVCVSFRLCDLGGLLGIDVTAASPDIRSSRAGRIHYSGTIQWCSPSFCIHYIHSDGRCRSLDDACQWEHEPSVPPRITDDSHIICGRASRCSGNRQSLRMYTSGQLATHISGASPSFCLHTITLPNLPVGIPGVDYHRSRIPDIHTRTKTL